MEQWQQRILGEKMGLDEKIGKLDNFIETSPSFLTIDKDEQKRLIRQLYVMELYSEILTERIEAF